MRQSDGTNTLDFQYDASGRAIGFKHNGSARYYYQRNVQGDVVSVVDDAGNSVAEYSYDAWGNVLFMAGPMAYINPIRYRGYYHDQETNWYWLQTRYYVASWKRFLNADCLFIAGDDVDDALSASNMYAYCNNNPVMFVDPSGTAAIILYVQNAGHLYGTMALLVQNSSGDWYFFLFADNNVFLFEMDSVTQKDGTKKLKATTIPELNNELRRHGFSNAGYKKSIYIDGDFSRTYSYCEERKDAYGDTPNRKNPLYSKYTRNCAHVAIHALACSKTAIYNEFCNPSTKKTSPSIPFLAYLKLKSMYPKGFGYFS